MLEMRHIGKSFSGVRVLQDVDFDLRAGEAHVLAGENGAGKSTLIKILSGVHTSYEGDLAVAGRRARFASPHDALRQGIAAIHQELSLVPTLSVLDNVFLGREMTRGGWLDRRAQERRLRPVLERLDLRVDLGATVGSLPLAAQQMVELAKALAFDARVFVMDEPTSALNEQEAARLLAVVDDLKRRGCGIIFITHRMDEVYRVADRITVLRDGRHAGTGAAADVPKEELVRRMIGRELRSHFPSTTSTPGRERLRVENLRVPGRRVQDVSFSVREGEILGLAGVEGSGRSEALLGLFGAFGTAAEGRVAVDGKPFAMESPAASIRRGVALLTSDRKATGLIMGMDVTANIALPQLRAWSRGGWRSLRRERKAATRQQEALRIRAASLDQDVATLSGGNQQKVALAKWLETEPGILLLDEPTRGIDVGAKHEVYELMNRWKAQGRALVLITSEMPELLAMSDRILVLHRGRVSAEFDRQRATQAAILRAAMGDASPS
jgi:ABC-type sugar transport system ATPase subunit